jgi:hypothetical protein
MAFSQAVGTLSYLHTWCGSRLMINLGLPLYTERILVQLQGVQTVQRIMLLRLTVNPTPMEPVSKSLQRFRV